MGLQLLWLLQPVSNKAGPLLHMVLLNTVHVNSTDKVSYGKLFIKNNKR